MALSIGVTLISVTIAAGQSLSPETDLGGQTLVGIYMPAAWSTAGLTFQISPDNGQSWFEHTSSGGVETDFTVAAGQYIAVDPTLWRGVYSLKLRSGTSAAPVAQTAGATLQLAVKVVN